MPARTALSAARRMKVKPTSAKKSGRPSAAGLGFFEIGWVRPPADGSSGSWVACSSKALAAVSHARRSSIETTFGIVSFRSGGGDSGSVRCVESAGSLLTVVAPGRVVMGFLGAGGASTRSRSSEEINSHSEVSFRSDIGA